MLEQGTVSVEVEDDCDLREPIGDHRTAPCGNGFRGAPASGLSPNSPRLLTRELLYTAFTRARQSLTVVGTAAALRSAVATPVARASNLSQQLLEAALVEPPAPGGGASATQK